jgi:hypothetical protein
MLRLEQQQRGKVQRPYDNTTMPQAEAHDKLLQGLISLTYTRERQQYPHNLLSVIGEATSEATSEAFINTIGG